ncbi:MAG: hypothetical protein WKF83_05725 [Nocardioidaceae bacterium]
MTAAVREALAADEQLVDPRTLPRTRTRCCCRPRSRSSSISSPFDHQLLEEKTSENGEILSGSGGTMLTVPTPTQQCHRGCLGPGTCVRRRACLDRRHAIGSWKAALSGTPTAADKGDAWVRKTVSKMTLKERVGQLFMTQAHGETADTQAPADVGRQPGRVRRRQRSGADRALPARRRHLLRLVQQRQQP